MTITVSGENKSGTATVAVEKAPCLLVEVSPSTISPGGTATISIHKRLWDCSIASYPDDQMFQVSIDSGGVLQNSWGQQGVSVIGLQPFTFIANGNVSSGTTITITAGPYTLILGLIKNKLCDTTLAKQKAYAAKLTKLLNTIRPKLKANKLARAKMLLSKKISPSASVTTGCTECADGNKAIVTITDEPELIVVYPTDGALEEKDIDRDPKMPDITLQAQLKNYTGGEVHFEWNLRIQWTGPDGRNFDDPFHKYYTTADNSDISSWKVDWNNMTRGGDEITLDVTATAGGKEYPTKTINHPFKIVGINPSIAQVKEDLCLEEQVMVYQESLPHWHQFYTDHDFPIWGYPKGYGLTQLDNRATDEQVWNWKDNKAAGKALFDDDWRRSKNLHKTIGHFENGKPVYLWSNAKAPTQDQALRNAYNLYNQGDRYYEWELKDVTDPNSGYWKGYPPNPKTGHKKCYADEAMDVYNTQPNDWNQ